MYVTAELNFFFKAGVPFFFVQKLDDSEAPKDIGNAR